MRTTRNDFPGLVAAIVLIAAVGAAVAGTTPPGTIISNTATVTYEDANANPYSASDTVTTTVIQGSEIDVSPDNSSTATPGDSVIYTHTVTNNGNDNDLIDMTASSTLAGVTTTFYEDTNTNGSYDSGVDQVLSDNGGSADPDTGVLAAGASVTIFIEVNIPVAAIFSDQDVTTVTGTSDFDNGVTESATDTTDVDAPSLSVTKTVAPSGDQPPGTTLTYTIVVENLGDANAVNVTLRDPIPANTTYVTGSITLDAGAITDTNGDDEGDYNITNPGEVTVDLSPVLPGAGNARTVTLQVTID